MYIYVWKQIYIYIHTHTYIYICTLFPQTNFKSPLGNFQQVIKAQALSWLFNSPISSLSALIKFSFHGWTNFSFSWVSLVAQMVKNPLPMRETWVRSPSWEDPMEEGMAIHSSTLAWRIPMVGDSSWGCKKSDTTERLNTQTKMHLFALNIFY